ncbi:MAG: metallophosphoesterase family protein, partial [Nitrospirae bacterium]|nr:metallophosphoesterase family protein [Nitrospirota bacterium]
MSYAVISDVHSNIHALEAVLRDINERGITDIFFTGDVVGYGPKPNECIELIKQNCKIILAGNHDWAAIGYTDITYFNQYAKHAIEWTAKELSEEHIEDLKTFNLVKSSEENDAFFAHSTPMDPELWSYLFSVEQVVQNFSAFKQSICFIGHSHLAVVF